MKLFLGGTFNPIHLGHLWIANQVSNLLNQQPVCFIPTGQPCHKTHVLDAKHRFNMLKLALHQTKHSISTVEMDRFGPSYTYETILTLKEMFADEVIVWLMGSDSWSSFNEWDHANIIRENCHLLVVNRHPIKDQDYSHAEIKPCIEGSIQHLNIPHHPANSTQIRNQHELALDWLTPEVQQYIDQHQLYRYNQNRSESA